VFQLCASANGVTIKNWDNYRFVLAMDRYGSVTVAAYSLGVSAITVSRHIENLTQEVGRPLFDFRNGRWTATELERSLSKVAQAIEQEDVRASNVIAGQDEALRGDVRINTISFIHNFFLAENIDLIAQKHPGILPILEASDKLKSLSKGEAEISVRLSAPKEVRFIRTLLCKFPIGLFKSDRGNVNEWVGLPEELDWLPEMKMAHACFGKPPRIRVDSFPGIAKAARVTGMVSLLPACISRYFSGISPLSPEEHIVVRDAWCVYHEMNKGNLNCGAVIDWIKEVLGSPRACACGQCTIPVN